MPELITGVACLAVFILLAFSPYFVAVIAAQQGKPKVEARAIQFSLRRLMTAIAVIAMGLSLVLYTVRGAAGLGPALAWVAGGTLIGAGIFVPTREWIQGGCLGLLATLLSGFFYLAVD